MRTRTAPISLHQRVTLLAASSVGVAVALMAVAAYFVVSGSMYSDVNSRLQQQADQLVNSQLASEFALQSRSTLIALRAFACERHLELAAHRLLVDKAGAHIVLGEFGQMLRRRLPGRLGRDRAFDETARRQHLVGGRAVAGAIEHAQAGLAGHDGRPGLIARQAVAGGDGVT